MQGDFDAHRRRLEQLGAEVVLVKKPDQLDDLDGLVIPGGESGTFLKLLGDAGFEKLKKFVRLKAGSATLRWKWSSFALPKSSTSAPASKSSPPKAATQSRSGREEPWPLLSTPSFPTTRAFTKPSSIWSPTGRTLKLQVRLVIQARKRIA